MKVSLFIPFTVIGAFVAAQLLLGTSLAIVAMCVAAVAVPFLLLGFLGRSLYSLMGISFSLKYAGIALVIKTFYGQTLESHLYDAYAAYGLTLLVMSLVTAMLFVASALDRGRGIFEFPMDPVSLRRLSVICIGIGIGGAIAFTSAFGTTQGGAAVVVGAVLREFFYFGMIAESLYAVAKTGGRSFVTLRLGFFFLIQAIISISMNERGALVTCLIGVITVAFLFNMLRIRHVILCISAGYFFIFVFTPITLYLRMNRTGLSFGEFTELAENTIVRAATDPEFYRMISDIQKYSGLENMTALVPYDYYGIRSDVLDRLSYVSLMDAVYNGTRTRLPLGMAAIEQTLARAAPGFISGASKQTINDSGPGDWLSWQTGLSEPGLVSFTVYALPMEGLAVWGLMGLIVYPFIFMLPVLYICGRLSSFRLPLPASIYLFVVTQQFMLDSSSDDFVLWLTRRLPIDILILMALHHVLRPRTVLPREHPV